MRVRVYSDIHVEFMADMGNSFIKSLNPEGVDVLCLAGDICNMSVGFFDTLKLFREQFKCPNMIIEV